MFCDQCHWYTAGEKICPHCGAEQHPKRPDDIFNLPGNVSVLDGVLQDRPLPGGGASTPGLVRVPLPAPAPIPRPVPAPKPVPMPRPASAPQPMPIPKPAPQSATSFCGRCGTKVREGKFCSACGFPLKQ